MKIFKGKIISIKMSKTITVEVERFLAHRIYKKRFKRNKKYQVHSEIEHKVGDVVKFLECSPISKTKRWSEVDSSKHPTGSHEVTKSTSLGKEKKGVKK